MGDFEYDFNGEWAWENDGDTFTITLWQDIDILRGQYCAIALNGNRIDEDSDNEARSNIFGVIKNNVAEVHFFSYYGIGIGEPGSCMGKATITLSNDNTITWKIAEPPANGYYWCPDSAVLKKTTKSKSEVNIEDHSVD